MGDLGERWLETNVVIPGLLVAAVGLCSRSAFAAAEEVKPPPALSYALWDIGPLGLSDETVASVKEMLLGVLHRVLGHRLVRVEPWVDAEMRHHISACGGTTECIVEVGGALGADRVILGVAGALGHNYSVNLKMVDVRERRDVAKAQAALEGEKSQILESMHLLILKLVDPSQISGKLDIQMALAGAEVYVDGKAVGTTPLPSPIEQLPAGEHALKITSPLMKDYFRFVTIHRGKTTHLSVDVQEIEALKAKLEVTDGLSAPFYQKWWFWPVVGGALAAVAGGTVVAVTATGSTNTVAPSGTLGTVDVRNP